MRSTLSLFYHSKSAPLRVTGFFLVPIYARCAMLTTYEAILKRRKADDKQTLGALMVLCGSHVAFSCVTLELPWRNNQPFISRIPSGIYRVHYRFSDTYGNHWHIEDVKGRDLILIHAGNFHRDTEGCVVVGRDYRDIDRDGYLDVTSSKATMAALNNAIAVRQFDLTVL